jgi:hypothetical protein
MRVLKIIQIKVGPWTSGVRYPIEAGTYFFTAYFKPTPKPIQAIIPAGPERGKMEPRPVTNVELPPHPESHINI